MVAFTGENSKSDFLQGSEEQLDVAVCPGDYTVFHCTNPAFNSSSFPNSYSSPTLSSSFNVEVLGSCLILVLLLRQTTVST